MWIKFFGLLCFGAASPLVRSLRSLWFAALWDGCAFGSFNIFSELQFATAELLLSLSLLQ